MKKLIAFTALISGLLLFLVPRFILPTCEYEGYPHMHCSDTAQAEFVAGALLTLLGGVIFFTKRTRLLVAGAAACCILYGVSFWLPNIFGYCQSPRMPCNYGTVPAVRSIAVVCLLIMIVAIAGLARSSQRKGNA